MLNRDNTPYREASAISRPVDIVQDGRVYVATAQEIRVQRVCNTIVNCVLGRRQSLSQYLATKHLGAAYVTALTAEDIVFNAFQLQKL